MTKVAMEAVDAVRRRLAVEIPEVEVAAEMERAYAELGRKAKVHGFRPGRAPRSVLERLFGDQIRAEVFGKLIQISYRDALRDQNIEPVGQPEIVTEHAEAGKPLRYSATVEVKPVVVATGYTGLEAERPLKAVTEAEVDQFLAGLRESLAQLRPITDRTRAARGDVATVDYEARSGNALVGRDENRLVEVGAPGPPGELGTYLDGAEVGAARAFDVDYPANHSDPDVAGRRVSFRVRVKAIAVKELPNLDDEFAKDYGECGTLQELRDRVRQRLEAAAAREAESAVRAALVAQLVRAHDVEVPRAMVARRAEAMADRYLEHLGPRRPPASREAEARAQLQAEFERPAREQVKAALILEAIARQEGLEVSDEELEEQIRQLAARSGGAGPRVVALYEEPAARLGLRTQLLQERALDLVVGRARVRIVAPASSIADGEGTR